MKQEYKELLLKVLCARLPYGLIVNINNIEPDVLKSVQYCKDEISVTITTEKYLDVDLNKASVKPYLRPLSSMTEEEKKEYEQLYAYIRYCINQRFNIDFNLPVEWLNAHHFDYHKTKDGKTMIEAGLALEAPEGMYDVTNRRG